MSQLVTTLSGSCMIIDQLENNAGYTPEYSVHVVRQIVKLGWIDRRWILPKPETDFPVGRCALMKKCVECNLRKLVGAQISRRVSTPYSLHVGHTYTCLLKAYTYVGNMVIVHHTQPTHITTCISERFYEKEKKKRKKKGVPMPTLHLSTCSSCLLGIRAPQSSTVVRPWVAFLVVIIIMPM